MNDEVNREVTNKTTALVFRAAKLTGDTLAKAMKAYLDHRKQASNNKEPAHGKMKLDELVGQGQGATSIEVTDNNIKSFEKVAKKYNVDFQEFAIDVEEVHLETFYKNYRIQDLDEKYNLSEFNDTFSKLNGDDELIEHLAEYARNHIYEFNWYAIEDIWLEPYIE